MVQLQQALPGCARSRTPHRPGARTQAQLRPAKLGRSTPRV